MSELTPYLTPYLAVDGATAAIEWYVDVLGARVDVEPVVMPDGRVGHCELVLGSARWMLSDAFPEVGVQAPATDRGAAVTLHLGVDAAADVDALAARVVARGVPMVRGPEDSEPAGRVAVFLDPFGHRWFLSAPAHGA
jgi:PhnB protein